MSLTFYYAPMSTASITEAVLAELGIPCERVRLDFASGDTRKPDFLAVNPNGKVPAIVHDGVAIWESAAITLYLGEVFGADAGLYPPPGPKRGEAMKWVVWSNVELAAGGGRLAVSLPPGTPGGAEPSLTTPMPSSGAAEAAKADLAALLAILDGGLADRPFLAGDYSLADTHVSGIVGWLGMMGVGTERFPAVSAWLKRCGERPAIAALMAR